MPCSICSGETVNLFEATVLNKHTIGYKQCSKCGYVFTEDPFWLDEAYARPINISDTGVAERNERIRNALVLLFSLKYPKRSRFLDYAGGYGLLTRMMRDRGFDYYWLDPLSENLFSLGFEMREEHLPYDAVSCCECFEHFTNPVAELEKLLQMGSTVFLTTTLIPNPPPAPDGWDYYGFSHGQHVSFYTLRSLRFLAKKYDMKVSSNGRNFHCLSKDVPSDLLMKIAFSPVARLYHALFSCFYKGLTQSDWKQLKERD